MNNAAIAVQRSALTKMWRWGVIFASVPLAVYAAQDAAFHSGTPLPLHAFPAPQADSLRVLEKNAAELLAGDQQAKYAQKTADASRAVLLSQPLNTPALRLLGVAEEIKSAGSGIRLLNLADKVSRRDLATQFALIESAAQSGDVTSTLRHYDHALSVYPEAGEVLYPILASAIQESEIQQALVPYATRQWFNTFANKALTLKADTKAFSTLISLVKTQLSAEQFTRINGQILSQLLTDERYADALELTTKLSLTSRKAIQDLAFTTETSDPKLGLLAWRFTNNEIANASLENNGSLAISIASNRSSDMARRLLILPAGKYRLEQTIDYNSSAPSARLTWELRCKGTNNAVIWREVIPAKSATYLATIEIPVNCPAQEWRLLATSAMSQFPSEATVTSLILTPAT